MYGFEKFLTNFFEESQWILWELSQIKKKCKEQLTY